MSITDAQVGAAMNTIVAYYKLQEGVTADPVSMDYQALRAALEEFEKALGEAEKPEWEYGNEQLMHSRTEIFPASSEAVAKAQSWLYPVHRRRKAGPWLPVEN